MNRRAPRGPKGQRGPKKLGKKHIRFLGPLGNLGPLGPLSFNRYHAFRHHPSMNIHHFEKGLSYSDRELAILARKIGKLVTYCKKLKDADSAIRVEAEKRPTKKDRDQVKVMITVELPKKILRAESRRNKVIEAIDRAMEKLEPQLKRYKEENSGRGKARRERTTKE